MFYKSTLWGILMSILQIYLFKRVPIFYWRSLSIYPPRERERERARRISDKQIHFAKCYAMSLILRMIYSDFDLMPDIFYTY